MKRNKSPSPSCSHQSKKQIISRSISIEFGLGIEDLFCNFKHATKYESDLHFLTINNVPSIAKSYDLLQQERFKSQISSFTKIIGLNLRINEVVDENLNDGPHFYDPETDKNIFVSFQSTIGGHESKTYWKDPTCGRLYSLFIDEDEAGDIAAFFHEFLIDEIKTGRNGLIRKDSKRKPIRLYEIGNVKGRNLLHLAIYHARSDVVKSLLKHEFDPDDEIDFAWTVFLESKSNESAEIVLHLLNANSRFPKDFDYEKASKGVQVFVDYCETLHNCLDVIGATEDDEFVELTVKLELTPELMNFYNRYNQSLLAHAIKINKFVLFVSLEKGLNTGSHEDLEHLYANLDRNQLYDLGFTRQDTAVIYPNSHLFALKSMTKIASNDQFHHKHWKFIDEAYKFVNSIDYCSKILKLASKYKKLKIFFDFKHDTIYYMDPPNFEPTGKTYGIFNYNYVSKKCAIFIGAKYLTDDVKKFEVFKVLAHELCHLAVHMAFYQPGSEPYPLGESQIKSEYRKVVQHCKNNEDNEEIIKNVFKSYQKSDHESELIVTVPEMLIKYHNNQEKLDNLKSIFHKLFELTELIVEPEIDRTLILLDVLEDESRSINFEDLTASMQAKILNTKVLFQGVETSLLQLIQDDEDIGRELTDKDIRMLLFDEETLSFGDTCESNLRHRFVERKFVERDPSYDQTVKSSRRYCYEDFFECSSYIDDICKEVRTSKMFLLADHAGTGKTTTFKQLTLKLKEKTPNFWISFINLRKCSKFLEKLKESEAELTPKNIVDKLLEMLNENSKFTMKLFERLYSKNQVILFLDGFDEICPRYKTEVFNILKVLNKSKIELWISTRPYYSKELETFFGVPAYKHANYSVEQCFKYVQEIVNSSNLSDNKKHFLDKNEVTKHLSLINSFSDINNLLMVEIITEIWMDGGLKNNNNSCYGIHVEMINIQRRKVGDKIPIEDHDKDSRISVWDIHRILALIYIIGDDYANLIGFKLEELTIVKRWKKEMKNWTADMIQRYGFVVVDLNDVERSISFMHKTYAEFFVAQFLILSISDDNDEINDSEMKRILQLFDLCLDDYFKFSETHWYIKSYFEHESCQFKFSRSIRDRILKIISNAYINLQTTRNSSFLENFIWKYATVVKNDPQISNKLWKIDENSNIFQKINSINKRISSVLLSTVEASLGLNWHEKFNKNENSLITHDEIDQMIIEDAEDQLSSFNGDHHLLKLCDLVDKNFEISDRKLFYKNLIGDIIIKYDAVRREIISRIRGALGKETFAEMMIIDTDFNFFNIKELELAHKIFAADNNSREDFWKILITSMPSDGTRTLSLILAASFPNIFDKVVQFFENYLISWNELKDSILASNVYDITCPTQHSTYSKYKELIENVFGNDTSKLADKISSFFYELECKIDFDFRDYENVENLKNFLNFVFKNDQFRACEIVNRIIEQSCVEESEVLDHHRVQYPSKLQNNWRAVEGLLSMARNSLKKETNKNLYFKYQKIFDMD